MTTQSIIVYRNPLEAALWESGLVFPIMVSVMVCIAVVLIVGNLMNMLMRGRVRWHIQQKYSWVPLAIGVAAMFFTIYKMA